MQRGLVFNIQRYSVNDGPGIRTTVFLKGCPLCCAWCHNPEGIARRPELAVLQSRCAACGECRKACPFAEALGGEGVLPTRNERCDLCGQCVEACPTGARQMVGREMSEADVMAEVRKDRIFFEESGGGVTFSGGEPLAQAAFVIALLGRCREAGIRTAVDTCGFGCTEHLLAIAGLADLLLYDLKLMDDARHREQCGATNRPILANLLALAGAPAPVWIRVPIVPGINDDEENLSSMARWVSTLPFVRQVNLLPYHKTGFSKHERMGHTYRLEDVEPPSPERMAHLVGLFRSCGANAKAGSA
jgi:pyruvate formate lyase activating enzyme